MSNMIQPFYDNMAMNPCPKIIPGLATPGSQNVSMRWLPKTYPYYLSVSFTNWYTGAYAAMISTLFARNHPCPLSLGTVIKVILFTTQLFCWPTCILDDFYVLYVTYNAYTSSCELQVFKHKFKGSAWQPGVICDIVCGTKCILSLYETQYCVQYKT